MRPRAIGRVLGSGLRIAGRCLAGSGQKFTAPSASTAQSAPAMPSAKSVARGVAGLLRPFRRAGGILWLEVTGVFFFLPVAVFAPVLWRTRSSYAHGPGHRTFLAAAVLVAVFLYLGVSSFWRARRK